MRRFLFGVLWLIVLMLVLSGACAWWMSQPLMQIDSNSTVQSQSIELEVESGHSMKSVAAQAAMLTGTHPRMLYLSFRLAQARGMLSGTGQFIRAGTYAIEPDLSALRLFNKLVSGDEIRLTLTVPEGWTFKQMRELVNQAPGLKHTTAHMSDAQLMQALGKEGVLAEGRFFPDTYSYSKNSSDLSLYKQAMLALDKRLKAAWDARVQSLPLQSMSELLILASLVEKETGQAADRAEIAGVFVNRLKKGMLLQTDPSVIYGMGARFVQQQRNIKRADLMRDTPYNTYTRAGLPPGPIALVGQAALQAAAVPKQTQALYFVARGDGSSQFSHSLQEHNAAVRRFILRQ